MSVLLGATGSIIGGVVANEFGSGDVFENNLLGSLLAITASIALVVIGERMGTAPSPIRRPPMTPTFEPKAEAKR